jgi:lipopolysaccharide biosynthesis glycosyltransferase
MSVACFTSFSFSYLAKARVLAESVKRHNPDWQMIALISDELPPGLTVDLAAEPFDRVIYLNELEIEHLRSWTFEHNVIELCTAVKGPFLKQLLEEGAQKVIYLDPDTVVFNSLAPLEDMLDLHSIIITPHRLQPEIDEQAIRDNELASLNFGVYNLGFLAIHNDATGRAVASWWSERLLTHCFDDRPHGFFVDQKWFDLVPAIFDNVHILRDPGYNVASWNLSQRRVEIRSDGQIYISGHPLRFYHFTKLGPIGDVMTARYAKENTDVYELWAWYRRQVAEHTDPSIPSGWWAYNKFDDGSPITDDMRRAYRSKKMLTQRFPDPFVCGHGSFRAWWDEAARSTA